VRLSRPKFNGAHYETSSQYAVYPRRECRHVEYLFVYGADAVMFDLEDAVSLREKDTARLLVHHALQHPFYRDVEKVVRINP
jgi:citrate lyase beta subunit